ncbi:MAG: Maf and M48 domain-containing protein [Candidatus Omnitrophota bacterium]|nr:Maf and M48 domain-containing protein [Candidatus Omnitrophota bacterium]
MQTIYLASESKARKELLKRVGLKFKVLPVKVRELRSRGNLSYAELVKRNALNKAKAAAIKVKNGIVIGADTITVEGKEIFGKPKNLKQARAMLKRLSAAPQDVYTGLAVIDTEKSRVLVAAEKTRVYMHRLSDKEISAYFSRVSPLDKAGSFDIQGRGAFFIRRLEGCFYNVVGLPLARFYRMLKLLDVKLFVLFFLLTAAGILLGGCSSEYNVVTGQEEQYYYSTEREVQMGRNVSKQVVEQLKIAQDPLMTKRVKDIGKKIVAVCDRKDIEYEFDVIEDPEVNAFSLPGGYVYINSGLIEKIDSDDELAGVIGHEVGHIVARHSIKRLQGSQLYTLLMVLASQAPSSGEVATAADAAITQLMLGYSREDELLADQLGARYLKKSGYNPQAMVTFLEKLQKIGKKRPLQPINYYKTHPYVPDRIRVVREELGQHMGFNDYINIQDVPHR